MANYNNPLDHFRSYSYHFILTVANSTEAHRKMIEHDSSGRAAFLQAVNGVSLGEQLKLDGETAFLLVDTRRFSQFSITSFESQQVYGTGDPANPSVPSAPSRMKLLDTTGLSFFNFLQDILRNKVQSTTGSAFFMLAITFVGHTDDNQTETISTCFIPMILMSLAFEFNSSGSTYDLEFMEVEGNPGYGLRQMLDLGDIRAVSTEGKSNTVGGMIQALEDRLNTASLQFYQKFTNEALAQANDAQQKQFTTAGKLVQYMLTLPEEWKGFLINTAGASSRVEQSFLARKQDTQTKLDNSVEVAKASGDKEAVEAATKARDSYQSFSPQMSIPDAIKTILESSRQYLELASKERRVQGNVESHKCVVNITSDKTSYVVHYDIYPFKATKLKEDGSLVSAGQTSSTGAQPNLIHYDYLFTGRNSQVMDLKIEFSPNSIVGLDNDLDLGGNRFAENASSGQKKTAVQENTAGLNKTKDFSPLIRPGEPIFIPITTPEQAKNFSGIQTEEMKKEEALKTFKAKQEHTNTLAVLHFLGSLQAQLEVRGNPNLMRKYADRSTRGGIAKHSILISESALKSLAGRGADTSSTFKQIQRSVASAKDQYYKSYVLPRIKAEARQAENDPLLAGPDIASGPVFVKLNIRAPNVDFMGNPAEDGLYTNKFFYQGAYMIMAITHSLDGGNFKHTMSLIPYDIDGSFSNAVSASSTGTPRNTI